MTRISCGCKINLFLEIGEKLPNGLHSLRSFFLPLKNPADLLEIDETNQNNLIINCDNSSLCNENNILFQVWRLFGEKTGYLPGLQIYLTKQIPVGAGLGGGSSDAAELLSWLNRHAPAPLDRHELRNLALQAGSDVPFFLHNNPALVSGSGEKVLPARLNKESRVILLLWPEIHISTAWAFAALDSFRAAGHGNIEKNLTKQNGKTTNFSFTATFGNEINFFKIANDLEAPVFQAYPELQILKDRMTELGAKAAGMSGSGSTIFGIFEEFCLAQKAAHELQRYYSHAHLAQWPSAGV